MQTLNPEIVYQKFFDKLAESSHSLLMLDYDGTLSPFTTDRDNAKPYEQVVPLLRQIVAGQQTRVVIISGRSVDILRQLIGDRINCELWGSHGAERFINGETIIAVENADRIETGLKGIDNWADANGLSGYLETKSLGRAFHWRGESEETKQNVLDAIQSYWSDRVDEYGLSIHNFDGGIELRPAEISKARAVITLLAECEKSILLAYLGDDLTDEDAFAAVGNRGLKVLVRAEDRETSADLRITPPAELIAFLDDWLRATSA